MGRCDEQWGPKDVRGQKNGTSTEESRARSGNGRGRAAGHGATGPTSVAEAGRRRLLPRILVHLREAGRSRAQHCHAP